MTVKAVFRFPNGMVAVTDERGEQIPELQGRFEDVKEKVEAAANEQTEWNGWGGQIMYCDCDDCGERYHDDDIKTYLTLLYPKGDGDIDALCAVCIRERKLSDARQVH